MKGRVYIVIILINTTAVFSSFGQVSKDVKSFVRNVLLERNPFSQIDSILPPENASHIILLEQISSTDAGPAVYEFGWNVSEIGINYILIADGPMTGWKVFGTKDLKADLVALKIYFDSKRGFKDATKSACYEYLIDNYQWW